MIGISDVVVACGDDWLPAVSQRIRATMLGSYEQFANRRIVDVIGPAGSADAPGLERRWASIYGPQLRDASMVLLVVGPAHLSSAWCWWVWRELASRSVPVIAVNVEDLFVEQSPPTQSIQVLAGELRGRDGDGSWIGGVAAATVSPPVAAARLRSLHTDSRMRGPRLSVRGRPPRRVTYLGRVAEVAEIRQLLTTDRRTPRVPTVVVHGQSGVGKSSLIAAYAQVFADCYPGGVWSVSCWGVPSLYGALTEIAADVVDDPAVRDGHQIWSALRGRGLPFLVLADDVADIDVVGCIGDSEWNALAHLIIVMQAAEVATAPMRYEVRGRSGHPNERWLELGLLDGDATRALVIEISGDDPLGGVTETPEWMHGIVSTAQSMWLSPLEVVIGGRATGRSSAERDAEAVLDAFFPQPLAVRLARSLSALVDGLSPYGQAVLAVMAMLPAVPLRREWVESGVLHYGHRALGGFDDALCARLEEYGAIVTSADGAYVRLRSVVREMLAPLAVRQRCDRTVLGDALLMVARNQVLDSRGGLSAWMPGMSLVALLTYEARHFPRMSLVDSGYRLALEMRTWHVDAVVTSGRFESEVRGLMSAMHDLADRCAGQDSAARHNFSEAQCRELQAAFASLLTEPLVPPRPRRTARSLAMALSVWSADTSHTGNEAQLSELLLDVSVRPASAIDTDLLLHVATQISDALLEQIAARRHADLWRSVTAVVDHAAQPQTRLGSVGGDALHRLAGTQSSVVGWLIGAGAGSPGVWAEATEALLSAARVAMRFGELDSARDELAAVTTTMRMFHDGVDQQRRILGALLDHAVLSERCEHHAAMIGSSGRRSTVAGEELVAWIDSLSAILDDTVRRSSAGTVVGLRDEIGDHLAAISVRLDSLQVPHPRVVGALRRLSAVFEGLSARIDDDVRLLVVQSRGTRMVADEQRALCVLWHGETRWLAGDNADAVADYRSSIRNAMSCIELRAAEPYARYEWITVLRSTEELLAVRARGALPWRRLAWAAGAALGAARLPDSGEVEASVLGVIDEPDGAR